MTLVIVLTLFKKKLFPSTVLPEWFVYVIVKLPVDGRVEEFLDSSESTGVEFVAAGLNIYTVFLSLLVVVY